MALIIPVRGFTPKIGKNCFLAPNATLVGDVEMGDECTIWFNAVVRGDVNSIRMGNRCNVQDGAVIHCTYQKSKVIMGNNVSVAHNAIIHGCTIEDNVLVGMGAIIMDNAYVGTGSIIAAGAVVLSGTHIEPHSIWAGNPAKFLKPVGEKASEIERIARNYPMYASWFQQEMPQ
ncbi:MAG: gamma carbonic anhydrase family protein [Raineya sp.]|nr:gamma carbonic anhydrase family protein [Raineya sp.]MDW8295788.1 gamma carbonic anhydrase family protein [Raineya sp.]